MANSQSALSVANLLGQEGQTGLGDEGLAEFLAVGEEGGEYMKMLIDREINGSGLPKQESPHVVSGKWIQEARLDAIQYILDTREALGFKPQTAYVAVAYVDAFLSRRLIEGEKHWAIRLLAMACLSLAAKMEECKVPVLSEFPGKDYNFESKVIQRMELLVLDTLDWRMGMVTPFAFTPYFVSKFCQNSSMKDMASRVVEVILMAIRDEKTMHYRPSVIAAAATLWIVDQGLTRETLELKISTLSLSSCLQIEDAFSFYNQMKELDIEKNKLTNNERSPLLSPVQLQRTDAMENSSVSSAVSAKRKSLTFNECDQKSELPDTQPSC